MDNKLFTAVRTLLARPFFRDFRTLLGLWLLLAVIGAVAKLHSCNNFLVFRGVFWHTWHQTSLYAAYPAEYNDTNYYGPVFSLLIAPFAVTPLFIGLLFWLIAITLALWLAVRHSELSERQQLFVYWFCAHELLTAIYMQQFNIAIAAIILLAYYFIARERDFWAAFVIVLGTMVKLYGIVGLAFFFFSRHKTRLLLSCIFWAAVMFVAPMLISSPDYVVGQYGEWFTALTSKNGENIGSIAQNISTLGLFRRISGNNDYSDLIIILPALMLLALPYLRRSQYRHAAFRQTLLASVLMFTVLFSTGSESSGYIIALTGVAVWYTAAPWQRSRWDIGLMVFVFILSSLSPSDLFPAYLRREWVQPYALKALPVTIVWLQLCYEMLTHDYAPQKC